MALEQEHMVLSGGSGSLNLDEDFYGFEDMEELDEFEEDYFGDMGNTVRLSSYENVDADFDKVEAHLNLDTTYTISKLADKEDGAYVELREFPGELFKLSIFDA